MQPKRSSKTKRLYFPKLSNYVVTCFFVAQLRHLTFSRQCAMPHFWASRNYFRRKQLLSWTKKLSGRAKLH